MPYLKQMIKSCIKIPVRKAIRQYQQVTWHSRSLPDFIIIGAQKSGTSSLYHYLSQHPQIFPSLWKEVHFFDGGLDPNVDNFENGQAWYRSHFPLRRNMGTHDRTMEASPLYLFNPLAPRRIFDLMPQVKIIAVLRNPTDRAISHFFHEKRKNHEPLSIFEALQKEENRLEPIIKAKDYKNNIFLRHSYKSRGLYKEQIERYLNYFSLQQLLIINSENFFSEPEKTLRRVYEFVGVDTQLTVNDLNPVNVGRNKTNVSPDIYNYLNNYFLPHNQALYELIGESYDW